MWQAGLLLLSVGSTPDWVEAVVLWRLDMVFLLLSIFIACMRAFFLKKKKVCANILLLE